MPELPEHLEAERQPPTEQCGHHSETPVPHRRPPAASTEPSKPLRADFRKRYDQLEAHRAALVARLTALGEAGQRHPAYKRALKLLNDTFRRSKLAQRLAILQAAAWLIDILEKTTPFT
jgi:hypothetical protein